ncbi:hypothetical protein BV898_15319 [Hypsibius exemplaris]|uniref:Uncharacterized protein n=1 Tax=Hypsibius exemplaris TaxID=2072580 RepID=A0A9X6NDU1_HYPEX|nr:hypothetical protein BV898_15319 [Hypsibius exemplaris]
MLLRDADSDAVSVADLCGPAKMTGMRRKYTEMAFFTSVHQSKTAGLLIPVKPEIATWADLAVLAAESEDVLLLADLQCRRALRADAFRLAHPAIL